MRPRVLFNSKIFLVFMAVVLGVVYWLPHRPRIWFLLVMSLVFYGFWDPSLLSLVLASIGVNWLAARRIDLATEPGPRKLWLWVALIYNLGTLGFFKYYDFFVFEALSIVQWLGFTVDPADSLLNLVLPVGISFYTFQTLGYVIDVHRREIRHEPDIVRFALYVTFFPQLVAGPVERASHLLPQFREPMRISKEMVRKGVFLILLGFVKKVVIADRLARSLKSWYEPSILESDLDGGLAALAQLLFTTQIYVDFSSYSDIAIGLGLLLGYDIRPNFNLPFVVPSIPERWRRWHISMSQWFRDYIFIPMGGSRKGTIRTQVHILILMLLSGLWHGASTNFLIWGLLNGLTMVSHRVLQTPLRALSTFFGQHWLGKLFYFYVCCWFTYCTIASINIFFRCPDWPTARHYLKAIFGGLEDHAALLWGPTEIPDTFQFGLLFTLGVFLIHEGERYFSLQEQILKRPYLWGLSALGMFYLIVSFGISGPQFIYFQF